MYILGISCFYHDSAVALIRDGVLVAAIQEERLSRIKHDFGFPNKAIDFCLDYAGITNNDLDYVVFYEKPFLKLERVLLTEFRYFPKTRGMFVKSMTNYLSDKLWIKELIFKKLGIPQKRILFCEHHLSHAASTFYPSPFDKSAILTIDGVGEWSTATLGYGEGTKITRLSEITFPNSLGLLYSTFTSFLGFQVNEGEYKVMGMAAYGKPRYVDLIYKYLVKSTPDDPVTLNLDYLSFHYSDKSMYNQKFVDLFGNPRQPDFKLDEYYPDVAASIQKVTEDIVLKLVRSILGTTKSVNLCLAGGVALNSVANGKILTDSPVENLFIQPAAGDDGGALGSAIWVYHTVLGKPREFVMENAYWGNEYSNPRIKNILDDQNIKYIYLKDEAILDLVIDDLISQKVVGWFQGRSEWGQRALGNRSIIADPRDSKMKDKVNNKIKFREYFRPFAPAILEEAASSFFDCKSSITKQYPARYMLLVLPLNSSGGKIPSVNHIGTSRLQTVREVWNQRFYNLIEGFGQETGVYALLNTSFNLKGEPIVESPIDALDTFYRSGLDTLVLGNYLVRK